MDTELGYQSRITQSTTAYRQTVLIRYADPGITITSGSARDLPYFPYGTIDWQMLTDEAFSTGQLIIALVEASPIRLNSQSHQEPFDQAVASMELAATSGDERAFFRAEKSVTWSECQPDDFVRVIKLALEAGAFLVARRIAETGHQRFPDRRDLQKYANVLAPPKVIRKEKANHPGLRLNRDWLKENAETYRNQWVALINGELIGSATSFKELIHLVGETQGVFFTKVY